MHTTEEIVRIVKVSGVHPKNPALHAADIAFLEKQSELLSVFTNPVTNNKKIIEYVRVDGGSNEGLSMKKFNFLDNSSYYNTNSGNYGNCKKWWGILP